MTKKNKDTRVKGPDELTPVGEIYTELQRKKHSNVELGEFTKEFNKDYMDNLVQAAMDGKKKYNTTFYVVVLFRRERLMKKLLRNGFLSRQSCPTPNYDQTVYKFNPTTEELEFLWVIPSPEICTQLYNKRLDIEIRKHPLMPYVVNFKEGKLLEKAKELNKVFDKI